MKKILFIMLLIGIVRTGSAISILSVHTKPDSVYICVSTGAKRYHRYVCKGLSHCTHEIKKVSKALAIKWGYTPCKICY